LTKQTVKLETRLRHIDIHQHWLRQEVEDGTITIKWLPTTEMPVDGPTKVLPTQKHATFIRQLNLKPISKKLGENHNNNASGGANTPGSDHGHRAAGGDEEEEGEEEGGRFAYSGVF
jgi:hypothetical protein